MLDSYVSEVIRILEERTTENSADNFQIKITKKHIGNLVSICCDYVCKTCNCSKMFFKIRIENEDVLELAMIYIIPDLRRQGYFNMLMNTVLNFANELNFKEIRLQPIPYEKSSNLDKMEEETLIEIYKKYEFDITKDPYIDEMTWMVRKLE